MAAGQRVAVTFRDGSQREGVIRKRFQSPLCGAAFVIDFNKFEYVIAPAAYVRRSSESGA